MSSHSDFDFNFENNNKNRGSANMEDIMDKVDKFSIDWDNFDAPHNNSKSMDKSATSDVFNKSKKSESRKSEGQDLDESRDIMEISMVGPQNDKGSFRFQKQDDHKYQVHNQRYAKLQQLLEAAKKDSLDQFYKNIDRENNAYADQPQKFASYRQFKDYIRDLKAQKRQKQVKAPDSQITNPFNTISSNRLYATNNSSSSQNHQQKGNGYSQFGRFQSIKNQNQKQPQYNFMKKTTLQRKVSQPKKTSNLLPNQFQKQDFFNFEQQQNNNYTQNPAQKYNNFYEGEKLPQKAADHNKQQDAVDFFDINNKKQAKKDKQLKQSLEPIRQEKHNSFEKTMQQQKLQNILKDYQVMRKNFQQLMVDMKSTSQGQEKLVTQFRKVKEQKHKQQLQEQKKERKERRERQIQEKNRKLDSIKDQIVKIKTQDKDILFTQVNKKIEQLQQVVRQALQQINEEKQAKMVPKVTNYFFQNQRPYQNPDDKVYDGFQQFDPEAYKVRQKEQMQKKSHSLSHELSQQLFAQKIPTNNLNVQSRKKIEINSNQQSAQRLDKQRSKKSSHATQKTPRQPSMSNSRNRQNSYQNFYSPLDLHLQGGISSSQFNYSIQQVDFQPQQYAEQYFPKQFQGYVKNLRNCLTQKSSVVYQSFDFHVSARFSVVDDQMHPIVAAMRVGNKCSIDLYDVHVITYGPQGPGIATDPSTIFQQQVKKSSSFAFQISLDKSCLQDNGFSIQISYKTDSMSKKKVNFKVPLPMVQLIRPQFIYQQKFKNDWQSLRNQMFIRPKNLQTTHLRSHEDVKLILPFTQISQDDPDSFSYGIVFRYPKSQNIFYLKLTCYVSGKALIQLRSLKPGDKKLKQQILNVINFIFCSP